MKIPVFFRLFVISLVAVFCSFQGMKAQKGFPYVSSFSFDETFENDNFDIIQDNHFNILIANRKGILTFDSRDWNLVPLPYFPTVLAKSPVDGTIYAGCRNGFGYLTKDITGHYDFQSLSDTLFTGEISSILINSNQEFFMSRNRIYFPADVETGIKYWEFPYEHKITGGFVFRDKLYFMIREKGLYLAENDTFRLVLNDRISMRSELVFAVDNNHGDVLVGTTENMLYLFNGIEFVPVTLEDSEYLEASIITDGACLGENQIAVSSLLGGVLICDYKTGQTSTILNYKTGLPDDETYCLGTDSGGGLWVGHSFGLSRIDNSLNVSNMTWYPGLAGSPVNSAFFRGQLFIGTSEGLYTLSEKREYNEKIVYVKKTAGESLREIPQDNTNEEGAKFPDRLLSRRELRKNRQADETRNGTKSEPGQEKEDGLLGKIISTLEGSDDSRASNKSKDTYSLTRKKVYSLQSISHSYEKIQGISGKCTGIISMTDHLMVSTNNGLYEIRNKESKAVLPDININFIDAGPGDTLLFAGTDNSFFIIVLRENKWEVARELDALDYPVFSACMPSPSELWLGSDNSAHKLTIDGNYLVDKDESLEISSKYSDKVIIRNIRQQLHFFLSSGIYCREGQDILPLKTFDNLRSFPVYYFSNENAVWYRSLGHWYIFGGDIYGLGLPDKYLNIFEGVKNITRDSDGRLWVIANNSEIFRIVSSPEDSGSSLFSVFFTGLSGNEGHMLPLIEPVISYKNSSLRIEFSAPYFLAPEKTEFSYRIVGLKDQWSDWSAISVLEYPLLPPGKYSIEAKARNIFNQETDISRMNILIKPPFWKTRLFYILIILAILGLFVIIVKFREKNLQNAKLVLEQKVNERTAEIERQKNEISDQKKEITDSIIYARRIQAAVLPSPVILNTVLAEHFVLFIPRDIVSGDFYWSRVKGDKTVVIAADCTGHGVPGAFMSMLGISFLNEIINEHKLDNAGDILNELRDHLKSTLANSGEKIQARDGMDIALCIIDHQAMKLHFAGAYNPLYMIREKELTEIKGDKMPIGLYEIDAGFTNNVIPINKGDCFYIFSDGFIDQFGGENEKKFLSRSFKHLLLKIHKQTMNKQKDMLVKTFENWKGELQQVDDLLVIGFRI